MEQTTQDVAPGEAEAAAMEGSQAAGSEAAVVQETAAAKEEEEVTALELDWL